MGAVVIFILLALLWVVLIVPRQRELRRHNALVASLEVGEEVITTSGVYGTITDLGDDHLRLEIAPGVTIKLARQAISARVQSEPVASLDLTDAGDVSDPTDAGDPTDPADASDPVDEAVVVPDPGLAADRTED